MLLTLENEVILSLVSIPGKMNGVDLLVTAKGQVTIPGEIRKKLGISPQTEVDFIIDIDGRVTIIKRSKQATNKRFSQLRGITTVNMTTAKIMALTRSKG